MKKIKNIFKILILIIILISITGCVKVQAYSQDDIDEYMYYKDLEDPIKNPNLWEPTTVDEPELLEKAGTILGVINVIGIVCSVIVLTIIGIKYMVGSVEEKAEYKKTMATYILGMFMLVSATTIPNLIYIVVKGMI